MEDLFTKLMEFSASLGSEYTDLRLEEIRRSSIIVKIESVESYRGVVAKGVGIRVLVNGAWGFASSNDLSEGVLKEAIKHAVSMAKGSSMINKRRVLLAETDTVNDKVKAEVDVNPSDVDSTEKLEYIMDLNKLVMGKSRKIKHVQSSYGDLEVKLTYANSEGTYIEQEKIYLYFYTDAMGEENGVKASAREVVGSTKGYGITKELTPDKLAEKVVKKVENQLKGKSVKAGKFPIVLGPEVVGLFTHEAFGHLSEADLVLSGAVTSQKIGQKVASDIVTIVDDGTIEGAFGSFKYDDEGVKTQKTIVVKEGTLISFLYDREHAKTMEQMLQKLAPQALDFFNTRPTGNARAENYRVAPIIRMRNTYIEPGEFNLDELFEDIKFGYYLVSPAGGQANLDGTFQGGIQEAYEIVNGEISSPVRNVSFSGNTLETLMKIDAIAKDFNIRSGTCGKFQSAYVGLGGPHLRVKELVMGGV